MFGKKFEISFISIVLWNFLIKISVYGRLLFVLNSYKMITKIGSRQKFTKKARNLDKNNDFQ